MAGEDEFETGQDAAALKRIVATLLALAVLVERLCGLPRPVRRFVLWILRRAEAGARELILCQAYACGVRALPAAMFAKPGGGAVAEASRLVLSFRAMAWAIEHMADAGRGRLPPGGWMRSITAAERFRAIDGMLHAAVNPAWREPARPANLDTS